VSLDSKNKRLQELRIRSLKVIFEAINPIQEPRQARKRMKSSPFKSPFLQQFLIRFLLSFSRTLFFKLGADFSTGKKWFGNLLFLTQYEDFNRIPIIRSSSWSDYPFARDSFQPSIGLNTCLFCSISEIQTFGLRIFPIVPEAWSRSWIIIWEVLHLSSFRNWRIEKWGKEGKTMVSMFGILGCEDWIGNRITSSNPINFMPPKI